MASLRCSVQRRDFNLTNKANHKMHTKYCVACGSEAIVYTGHIHTEIGTIIAGWCGSGGYCKNEGRETRPRYPRCSSVNPHSCYGVFQLKEVELREVMTSEVLIEHAKSEEFSNMIDLMAAGVIPISRDQKPKKTEQKNYFISFFDRLFS